jgi:hypothetical protein
MSARQRSEAYARAREKGREARDAGQDRYAANPYKRPGPAPRIGELPSGFWSNWPAFDCGWQERDNELRGANS